MIHGHVPTSIRNLVHKKHANAFQSRDEEKEKKTNVLQMNKKKTNISLQIDERARKRTRESKHLKKGVIERSIKEVEKKATEREIMKPFNAFIE